MNKITKLIATGIAPLVGAYPTEFAKATGLLTSNNTNASNTKTITIDGKVYTFVSSLAAAYDIKIGADADTTLGNLIAAINGASGAGTKYGTGTSAHPTVSAGDVASHTVTLTARTAGKAGNNITLATTETTLSFGSTHLTILEVDAGDLGSIAAEGANQVTFSIVNVTDTTATLTVSPQELFSYPDNQSPQVESVGYVSMWELGTSPAMQELSRTFTGASAYTFTLPKTIADRVRLRIKSDKAVKYDLYQSISLNQG